MNVNNTDHPQYDSVSIKDLTLILSLTVQNDERIKWSLFHNHITLLVVGFRKCFAVKTGSWHLL